MAGSKLHEWLRPRLQQLLQDAEAAGFAHEAAVAVMIDVMTGSAVNDTPLPPEPPLPDGPWPRPPDDDLTEVLPELSGQMPNMLGDFTGRRM